MMNWNIDECRIPDIRILETSTSDPSTLISTSVGMFIAFTGMSYTFYSRQRSWWMVIAILVTYFLMQLSAQLYNCWYYQDWHDDSDFPPNNMGRWFYLLYECSRTWLGVNMIFLAFFDCSLFPWHDYVYGLISVTLLLFSIFLWSRYFKEFAIIDENAALPYASDMGVTIYALVELVVLCYQQDYWRVLFLIAFLFLWISGMGLLKRNMYVICDNPIWHWYTYVGLWCTMVDILYASLFMYYYTKINPEKHRTVTKEGYLKITDEESTDFASYRTHGETVDPFSKQPSIIREQENYVPVPSGLIISNGIEGKLSPAVVVEDITFLKSQFCHRPNHWDISPTPPSIPNNSLPARIIDSPDFNAYDKEEPQEEKRGADSLDKGQLFKNNHWKNSEILEDGKKMMLPSSPEHGQVKSLLGCPNLKGRHNDAESNVFANEAQRSSIRPVVKPKEEL